MKTQVFNIKTQVFKKPVFWLGVIVAVALVFLLISFILGNSQDTVIPNNNSGDSGLQPVGDDDGGDQGNVSDPSNGDGGDSTEKIDDWVYSSSDASNAGSGITTSGPGSPAQTTSSGVRESAADSSIGFAVGGANDINNFRRNIDNDYLPSPAEISHEGIFYDYFFETGITQECEELFCPSYSTAVSADPFSEESEYFLSVGLNSNIAAEDFKRKKLNLVVVLDISGSMSSSFDTYYYDQLRNPNQEPPGIEESASKMEVANQSLVALLDHLDADDRLGVVLFDNQAHVAKDLRLVGETDMAALKDHILEITPQGGTNMEAGYRAGSELLDEYKNSDSAEYENRIIFLTDAMPNLGNTDKYSLALLAEDNAEANIYTTFIGVGLDFNAELIRAITQTRGANYYAVHSKEDFKQQLDDNFEYMVTPLVFDLTLTLKAEGYKIKAVYGSPEADLASGEIMKINTLFPSQRSDGRTKGGLVLLHLEKLSDNANLELAVDYSDRAGEQHQNNQAVEFKDSSQAYFDNSGIRKGVALSRFVNVMEDWLRYESKQSDLPIDHYIRSGIPIHHDEVDLSYWERTSRPLKVSARYRSIMSELKDYLSQEFEALDDESLERELELLDKLLDNS